MGSGMTYLDFAENDYMFFKEKDQEEDEKCF